MSLKFCKQLLHVTVNVLQKIKVNGSKVKVTARPNDGENASRYLQPFRRESRFTSVTDKQTDRRTDGRTDRMPLAIARPTCAKNRNKNSFKTCCHPFVHCRRFFSRTAYQHEIIELLRQGLHHTSVDMWPRDSHDLNYVDFRIWKLHPKCLSETTEGRGFIYKPTADILAYKQINII